MLSNMRNAQPAATGTTDPFGRELSTGMAVANAVGVKLGAYPEDVLLRNLNAELTSNMVALDTEYAGVKRSFVRHGISEREFLDATKTYQEKKQRLRENFARRISAMSQ